LSAAESAALMSDPAIAGCNRGIAHKNKNDFTRSIAGYDEAIRLAPQFANASYGRELAKQQTGDATCGDADFAKGAGDRSEYRQVARGR
jgi:hypothetical protein